MSKDEFYNSITEDMAIDEDFLKGLHAYSLYDPQFLLDVLQKFDEFGRRRVADLFTIYMFFYEEARNEELLPAARWLRKQIDEEYERKRKAGDRNANGGKTPVFDGLPQDW